MRSSLSIFLDFLLTTASLIDFWGTNFSRYKSKNLLTLFTRSFLKAPASSLMTLLYFLTTSTIFWLWFLSMASITLSSFLVWSISIASRRCSSLVLYSSSCFTKADSTFKRTFSLKAASIAPRVSSVRISFALSWSISVILSILKNSLFISLYNFGLKFVFNDCS